MHTVVWNDRPVAAINDAIAQAADQAVRKEIVGVVEEIVDLLSADPLAVGESRGSSSTRVMSRLPVTVYYRLESRLSVVRVFAAVVYRRVE